MSFKLTPQQKIWLWVIVFVILVAFLAAAIHILTSGNTIGNDILVFYLAAQSSFKEGTSPYLNENAVLSQLLTYGKLAQPGEDFLTFSYPPFALIPILPLIMLPFEWAQAIWLAFLILGTVLILLISFPKAPRWLPISIFLMYPITFGLIMGNFVILIFIIIIANLFFFFRFHGYSPKFEILLAAALAWSVAKPQFSWLYVLFFLVVAIKQHRKLYILSFACTLGLFILLSFLISPGWVQEWLKQISFYAQTNPVQMHLTKFLSVLLPATMITVGKIILVTSLLYWVCRYIYQYSKGNNDWLSTLSVIGFCSHLLYPGGVAYQQVIFLIPFVTWMSISHPIQARYRQLIFWLFAIILSWMEFIAPTFNTANLLYNEWFFIGYSLWMIFILKPELKITHSPTVLN